MKLLKALNKGPLVTLSQKGSENTIASMWRWQKHKQILDLEKKLEHAKQFFLTPETVGEAPTVYIN